MNQRLPGNEIAGQQPLEHKEQLPDQTRPHKELPDNGNEGVPTLDIAIAAYCGCNNCKRKALDDHCGFYSKCQNEGREIDSYATI